MALKETASSAIEQSPETSTLEQQVYERIKAAILNKEIKPGEKIGHADWAERLSISRTPVRDALKRLEFDGLVIRETERQWHVYTLSVEDVRNIFDAREAIDTKIAFLAAKNITQKMEEELRKIFEEADQTQVKNDYEAYHAVDDRFHALLNQACQNEYLADYNRRLVDKLARVYPKGLNIEGRLQASIKENRLIAQAIFAHDAEKAAEAQLAHLRAYRDHFLLVINKIVIPFSGPAF